MSDTIPCFRLFSNDRWVVFVINVAAHQVIEGVSAGPGAGVSIKAGAMLTYVIVHDTDKCGGLGA